jgi:hypothetical protein
VGLLESGADAQSAPARSRGRTRRQTKWLVLRYRRWVPLRETNRLRLERLTARYRVRHADRAVYDARAAFERAFIDVRDRELVPLLHELGAELRRAGHDYNVEIDGDVRRPSILFCVPEAVVPCAMFAGYGVGTGPPGEGVLHVSGPPMSRPPPWLLANIQSPSTRERH